MKKQRYTGTWESGWFTIRDLSMPEDRQIFRMAQVDESGWVELLNKAYRAGAKNKWIPVSELPEQRIRVLVKDHLGFVTIGYYGVGNRGDNELLWRDSNTDKPLCNLDGTHFYPPVAWQPLPEA
jgi:hypothetical protein